MIDVRKPAAVLATVLAAGTAISAMSASAASAKTSLFTIKVGISPTISSADVLYAQQAGYFKKEGLNVIPDANTTSGAATVPLVLKQQLAMTVSDPVAPTVAIAKGVPLQIVAKGNVIASDPSKNYVGLMVKSSSGITSPKQLDGKTVAVNSLDSILQMWAQVTIDSAGGKSSSVKFVEVPPLSEVDAVANGQVSAFENVEPLLTEGKADGLKTVAHPPATLAGLPEDVIISSSAYVKAHPTIVAKFRTALQNANAELAKDPSLVMKTAVSTKEVTAALARKIIPPVYQGGSVTPAMLNRLMTYMVKYHYISKKISPSKILG